MNIFRWILCIIFWIGIIELSWADGPVVDDVFAESRPAIDTTLDNQSSDEPFSGVEIPASDATNLNRVVSIDPNSNPQLMQALSEALIKEHPELKSIDTAEKDKGEGEEDSGSKEEKEPLTLADLRPAVKLPHTWVFYTVWSIVILLVIVILWLIHRTRRSVSEPVIELSPYAQALNDLENAQALMHKQNIKPFIIAITDAIRTYFSRGFSLPAPECTTEELLEALKMVKILSEDTKELIADFFQQCDLAKFTKQTAENVESIRLYKQAKTILQTADRVLQPPESQDTEGETNANLRV